MRFLEVGIDFLLIQTLTEFVLSINTIGRTYTLFTAKKTWNEVQDFCVTSGSSMLKIGSEEEMKEFKQIMKTWENNSLLTDYLWLGLYDSNLYNGKHTVYQWQQDCTNLTNNDQTWRPGDPSDKDIDHCVAVTLEGKYRTRPCNQLYHTVCEKKGPCGFDDNKDNFFVYSELESKNASDMNMCEQECLNRVGNDSECIAIDFDANICNMYVLNTTELFFFCPSPATLREKTCYTGETSSKDIVVTSNTNLQPEDRCNQPANNTTTVVTTTTPAPSTAPPTTEASPILNCTANSGIQWVDPGKLNVTYLNECLLLNKKSLSFYVRSLTSAEDGRPSAIALGAVWSSLLLAAILCILLMDIDPLFKDRKPTRRGLVQIHKIVD